MTGCENNTGRSCQPGACDIEAVVGAIGEAMLLLDKGRPVAEVRDVLGRLLVTVAIGTAR